MKSIDDFERSYQSCALFIFGGEQVNQAVWEAIAEEKGRAAVHCPTRKLANEVVAVVKAMTGRGFAFDEDDHWEAYKEDTCYYPNVGVSDGRSMQYSDMKWATDNDTVLFSAVDLLTDVELPISLSEVNIKSLFGME